MEVWMIRHGQTEDNLQDIIQGSMQGKLTDLGMEQAKIVGNKLSTQKFSIAYSSDLKRAVDTSEIILSCTAHKPELILDQRLREKSGGIFEGKPRGSTTAYAVAHNINPREFVPEGGESWLNVYSRVTSFFTFLLEKHAVKKEEGKEGEAEKILCISHGGFISEILNVMQDLKGLPLI
mmetsp:Transcript_19353/g.18482  ORF Transcript_19353/g.18482 Transcript_19353/m.18482 type:complete len:178 (+) Transcript_19353:14-547(+)|eukprot:CAMPEP_0170551836 /NCGR_PEP_ID=MMETSP0211-20121228/9837_1 /TAXON_ID=311385 /ORGANISM="Pseudokeronopsis sp., Strain OXSARD2" /LENGTH=177 /DNA_ID=CAMNT_0010859251 /DNA_START=6 /DNA_END=539 /DNA_ORIENTATION=-